MLSSKRTPAIISTTGKASIRLAHGNAPTSPVDGDTWTTAAGFFSRISGSTVGPFGPGSGDLTAVTVGLGLDVGSSGGPVPDVTLDFGELAERSGLIQSTGRLIGVDTGGGGSTMWAETVSQIPLGIFNNNQNWTANVGTVTNVIAGVGLTGGGTPTPTLTFNAQELNFMASGLAGGDDIVVNDGSVTRRAQVDGIDVGIFNDDGTYAAASHNHSADDINADVLNIARIPDLNASKIDAGIFGTGDYIFPGDVKFSGTSYHPAKDHADGTGATSVLLSQGNIHNMNNEGSRTITITNLPTGGVTLIITIVAAGGASSSFAWTGGGLVVEWAGGLPPVLSTTSGWRDVIHLVYSDNVWHGSYTIGHR